MRLLRLLFAVALFPAFISSGKALVIYCPPEAPPPSVSITERRIHTDIDGVVATTVMTETMRNDASVPLEGSFLIPIPRSAQVTDFSMTVNGKKTSAEVLTSEDARKIYEEIVRKMRDPAILEYVDERTYRVRIFPVPAHDVAKIELKFVQQLERQGGLYRWRYESAGDKEQMKETDSTFEVSVKSAAPLGLISSTTHQANIDRAADGRSAKLTLPKGLSATGSFELLYAIDEKDAPLHLVTTRASESEAGYFLLMIAPTRSGTLAQTLPKRVVFVLDTSGSMEDDGKFDKAISALRQCLNMLTDADEFNIITFASTVELYRENPVGVSKTSLDEAKSWLEKRSARGGTNISDALAAATKQLDGGDAKLSMVRQVVFMTDGIPTVGKTDTPQILGLLGSNPARVFTLGFGYDVNAPLLDAIAARSNAFPTYIQPREDLERTVTGLFEAISSPVLTNLDLQFDGIKIEDQYPKTLPDLYAGRELIVAGRYKGDGKAQITLKGRASGDDYSANFDAAFPKTTNDDGDSIRSIWAGRKIAYLLDAIRQNGENSELKEEIQALARQYGIVTPYTTMLAAPDENYAHPVNAMAGSRSGFGNAQTEKLTTGRDAVQMSVAVQAQKQADHASEAPASTVRKLSDGGEAVAFGGAELRRNSKDGAWVDLSLKGDEPVVKIKYLSNAYYALLRKFPAYKKQILAGESVEILINGKRVIIGPEGEEEKLPL